MYKSAVKPSFCTFCKLFPYILQAFSPTFPKNRKQTNKQTKNLFDFGLGLPQISQITTDEIFYFNANCRKLNAKV